MVSGSVGLRGQAGLVEARRDLGILQENAGGCQLPRFCWGFLRVSLFVRVLKIGWVGAWKPEGGTVLRLPGASVRAGFDCGGRRLALWGVCGGGWD